MADSAFHTRPSLLVRIKDARDDDAWATFVQTYAPLVYGYCRRRGLQASDAADVVQEVMAKVARSMRAFDYRPDRGRFRDWLGTLTHRTLLNHLRAGRRAARGEGGDEPSPEPAEPESPGPAWAEEFHARVLRVALERIRPHFEPATWRAFERAWVDGRPAAEVADELGLPIDAVYSAKSRALKRLREEVLALAEDLPLAAPLG
jgi:RNA polymerase sigma-70 factor (ECF subfamily)